MGCIGCRKDVPQETAWPETRIQPINAYRLFAGVTGQLPNEVRDLQVNGAAWMDLHVLCRFRAPEKLIDGMISNGYQRTNWEGVVEAMHSKNYTESFSPKWDPDSIKFKECYAQQLKQDHGTDRLYLVIDRLRGVVYAVAEGETHK